jgi:hypothetical protein
MAEGGRFGTLTTAIRKLFRGATSGNEGNEARIRGYPGSEFA